MTRELRTVALFAGNDLSTQYFLPALLSRITATGFKAKVYYTEKKTSARSSGALLSRFALYERRLLTAIHAVTDKYPLQKGVSCYSPKGLAEAFNVEVEHVDNVNSLAFLNQLESEAPDGSISIRCLQIFSPAFIKLFHEPNTNRFLWNLHSGAVPQCRGAMPLFWTMLHQLPSATLTLHEVNQGIDTGRVIEARRVPINYDKSLLETSCDTAIGGARLVLKALEQHHKGRLNLQEQTEEGAEYNSYPTDKHIGEFLSLGCSMVPPNVSLMLAGAFSPLNSALFKEILGALERETQLKGPRFFNHETKSAFTLLLNSDESRPHYPSLK